MNESSILSQLLPHVGELALAVMTALVAWASASVKRLIDTKVTNARTAAVLERLNGAVWTAVLEVQQTIRPKLAAKTASGKLSLADAEDLARAAAERAKQLLGPSGWAELVAIMGSELGADRAIKSHLEGRVVEAKAKFGTEVSL